MRMGVTTGSLAMWRENLKEFVFEGLQLSMKPEAEVFVKDKNESHDPKTVLEICNSSLANVNGSLPRSKITENERTNDKNPVYQNYSLLKRKLKMQTLQPY